MQGRTSGPPPVQSFCCTQSSPEPFGCQDCDFTTDFLIDLWTHSNGAQPIGFAANTHYCNNCTFRTASSLHWLRHKCAPRFKCPHCSYKTARLQCLRRHELRHLHPEDIKWFTCPICFFKTKRKDTLLDHSRRHGTNGLKCRKCPYVTTNTSHLKRHELIHLNPSEIDWLQCEMCQFKTKRKQSLKRHSMTHLNSDSRGNVHKCGKCPFAAMQKLDLRRHEVIHLNPETIQWFECDHCAYKGKHKAALAKHLKRHTEPNFEPKIYRYTCDKCPYKTARLYRYHRHQIVHIDPEDREQFECDKCSFETKRKDSLRRHLKKHEANYRKPEKKIRCAKCPYKALYRSDLKLHELVHLDPETIERKFQCDKCDYKAMRKTDLRKHQVVHSEPKECDQCGFKTKYRLTLVRHFKMHESGNNIK